MQAIASPIRWLARSSRPPAVQVRAFDPADFTPALKTRLLILQPTPFCNIDCSYCYLPHRNSTARMDLSTVRRAVERLCDDGLVGHQLTIVWHAGEPLTLPPSFYERAITEIRQVLDGACDISHSIQTNGTLINDEWCALFKRHGIRIGVSVDGPADLHDAYRRTRSGRGTHGRVVRGMERLRAHGIPFHAIAVVTAQTFSQPDAFYDFFAEQRVSELGCNYDEAEGLHQQSSLNGNEAAHAAFLQHLLKRATTANENSPRLRELAMALEQIRQPMPTYRWEDRTWPDNAQTLPFALISVACNGDFSSFSPELLGQPSPEFGDFILGNVASDGYIASARTERFQRIWSAIAEGTRTCEQQCAHFHYCGGGAPANKLYENGSLNSGETLYCRTMIKRPFEAVLASVEALRAE